jgi:hypothetical protein
MRRPKLTYLFEDQVVSLMPYTDCIDSLVLQQLPNPVLDLTQTAKLGYNQRSDDNLRVAFSFTELVESAPSLVYQSPGFLSRAWQSGVSGDWLLYSRSAIVPYVFVCPEKFQFT